MLLIMDYADLVHRVGWTFIQAAIGTVASINLTGIDVEGAKQLGVAAVTSGVAAVVVVIKEFARNQLSSSEPGDG